MMPKRVARKYAPVFDRTDDVFFLFTRHIFDKYPAASVASHEKIWNDTVPRINNKLKNMRKEKYVNFDCEK